MNLLLSGSREGQTTAGREEKRRVGGLVFFYAGEKENPWWLYKSNFLLLQSIT